MNVGSVLLWGFVASLLVTASWLPGTVCGCRASACLCSSERCLPRVAIGPVSLALPRTSCWDGCSPASTHLHSKAGIGPHGGSVRALASFTGSIVLIAIMPMLPVVHPRMASEHRGPEPTRQLEPPGFMALHYGRRTPLITLIAHVLYGMVLGAFYQLARP